MADAVPPTSPSPPPASGLGSAAPTATVPAPPPALLQLPPGARIEVSVSAATAGTAQVTGNTGTFTLQSSLALSEGSTLLLQVQSRGTPLLLQFLAIDGRPPGFGGSSARIPGNTPATAPPTLGGPPSVAPAGLITGTILTAALLKPVTSAATSPSGNTATWPGTTPSLTANTGAANVAAGATGATGAASANPTSGPLGQIAGPQQALPGTNTGVAQPSAARSGPVAAPDGPAQLVKGVQDYARQAERPGSGPEAGRFGIRLTAVQSPTPGSISVPPTVSGAQISSGTTFTGVVTGTSQAGQPIVQTAAGQVVLLTETPVVRGTTITFQVTSPPVTLPATSVVPAIPDDISQFRDWQTLREAVSTLQQANPAAARHMIENVLPRADSQMTASILFFMSALRGGSLRGWMGDSATRALQRARPDLAIQLGDELRQIARLSDDSSGNWRAYLIPFHNGAEVEPIRMFMRRPEKEGPDDQEPGTRFILDIQLTRIGRFQIDGLIQEKSKRFDLMIRSDETLPNWMRADIHGLFETALDVSGQIGSIAFHANPANFTEPTAIPSDTAPGVVI